MANEGFDFNLELKKLKCKQPDRLYLLYGEEDYLISLYYNELKNIVIPDGDNGFNYKKISSAEPDIDDIINSLDILPFMSERTFIELRGFDTNKYKKAADLIPVLKSIPDYCTVAIIPDSSYSPDMRLKLNKEIKELGLAINFETQPEYKIINWIQRRFKADNKVISESVAERLIFISGDSMSGLIPEIEKVAAYSKKTEITLDDVNEAAHHLPEADVFEMVESLSMGKVRLASSMLSELLYSKETGEPIYLISMIGMQFKKLLSTKVAVLNKKSASYLVTSGLFKYEKFASNAIRISNNLELNVLSDIVDLCATADYRMKQGQFDAVDVLSETFTLIAARTSKC